MHSEYDISTYTNNYFTLSDEVYRVLHRNLDEHVRHPSLEHSFLVVQEEFEELKKELYVKESKRDNEKIIQESIDLLATVYRLLLDHNLLPDHMRETANEITVNAQ